MRITANTLPLSASDHARSAIARRKTETATAAETTAAVKASVTQPANLAEEQKRTEAPAGLSKALARLQAIPESERTSGQSNAAQRISRNIARYLDVQSMVPPPTAAEASNPGVSSDTLA